MGNILNRVFDSSGPEGKVRGTPQQIIDKYNQLARDAQLSNDRVAAENFQQHAEHYARLLSEAQREQEARREQQEAQARERQQQQAERREHQQNAQNAPKAEDTPKPETPPAAASDNDVLDVVEGGAGSGLVETPEAKPAPRKRSRKPSKPKETAAQPGDDVPQAPAAE
ncbi:hypothetical protein ATO10_03585 [Actibacterium atlanticum]|uniref:DUF4167 domain-containing protein n=2 Tax=Actibacterium atlanticum TaxID=1461693 RepID=A0A058ZSL3_9RHOB|nr:hypothetical protein ATO10_03585 [Actibacterium atlanticum]